MINDAICDILDNKNSDINLQECFDEIFSGLSNPILSGVFLSLIKNKEESTGLLLSAINSARNAIKKINLNIDYDFLIENICLDEMPEYLDISFAMDVVCSACNIGAIKSVPSDCICKNNSYKTLKALGVEVSDFKIEDFEETHFIYNYIPLDKNPYLKYTQELLRTLPYKTILDIINHFLNPYNIKNCTLALKDVSKAEMYAQLCLELGYINSVIFSSGDFPYVSIETETKVCEAWKNKIFSYAVSPELLGIKPNSTDCLKIDNHSHGIEIIKAVFENKLKDSFYDAIIINSGFALYITKKTKSLMEGIDLARKAIDDGLALQALLRIKK